MRSYNATLTFALSFGSTDVRPSLDPILKRLSSKGYGIEVVTKDKSLDVDLHLQLPEGASCANAEEEIKAATEILGYPGRMAIKERSGAKRSRAWGPGRYWVDISPADYEWTDNSAVNIDDTVPIGEGAKIEA